MNKTVKLFLSGLVAGLLAFVTGLGALATDMGPTAAFSDIGMATWISLASGALVVALKDWRTFLASPPK